jgi:hexosaminidase
MIDVSRHFIPVDVIKRNIDGMEAVKMNVFPGISRKIRVSASKQKFPKLLTRFRWLFYTQDEVRDLIVYARDRGIRVVPDSTCLVTVPPGLSATRNRQRPALTH